jgi:hypothetical protein
MITVLLQFCHVQTNLTGLNGHTVTSVIIMDHHQAPDYQPIANVFKTSADGFVQLYAPLSRVTVAHCKKEDKDDGENSKDERERARNHWQCEKGCHPHRDRRQTERKTEWQQHWKEKKPKQKHAARTGAKATLGVFGCKLASGTTERVEHRKMIRPIVATAQPAKLVAARAACHVVASEKENMRRNRTSVNVHEL